MPDVGHCRRSGYAIAWRRGGQPQGEPLVLLHSLGTSCAMWEPQSEALADRCLLRLDWPGHGDSSLPPAHQQLSIESLCADVEGVLDEQGWSRVDVLGLSLGGMVGLAFASRSPARCRRLVVSNCAAHIADPTILARRLAGLAHQGLSAIADDVLDGWFSPSCHRERPELIARARQWLLSGSSEGYIRVAEAVIAADLRSAMGAISCPTTVISGSLDRPTPPAWQADIAAAIPGARHHVLCAGHLANLEAPTAYAEIVRDALAG